LSFELKGAGKMKRSVVVTTTIKQYLEVPENASDEEVLFFLAATQSFRDAFVGVEAQGFEVVNIVVADEVIED
jgi:hypothetical protein